MTIEQDIASARPLEEMCAVIAPDRRTRREPGIVNAQGERRQQHVVPHDRRAHPRYDFALPTAQG